MVRSYKNIPSLHRFIETAPVEALKALLTGSMSDASLFADVSWAPPTAPAAEFQQLRAALLARCAQLPPEVATRFDGAVQRILTLVDGSEWPRLEKYLRDNLYRHDDTNASLTAALEAQRDRIGRATLVQLRAPDLFDAMEKLFYAEHYRNYGRQYEAYDLDTDGTDGFEWTDARCQQFEILLQERLGLDRPCLVQHLPCTGLGPGADPLAEHLFLIRHAGAMDSVQQVADDLSTVPHYFRPPVEATVMFFPDKKLVEVCTADESQRFLIASAFAKAAVDTDLSSRPVTTRQHNLQRFYRSLSLPQDVVADLPLVDVRVVEAEARPANWKRRVQLRVDKNDDIEDAVTATLGDNNIFRQAALISRVVINVRYTRGGKEVNLPITLSTPNRCNLASRRDPQERELGFAVLERYGITRRVVMLDAQEEANLFDALIRLYESDLTEVRRSQLEAWEADTESLRVGGFLKPMGQAQDVARIRDDGSPVRLPVRAARRGLVADDPETGESFDVEPRELERYEVARGWVQERIIKGLRGAMRMARRPKGDGPAQKLGTLVVGEQEVPVFLARRLDRLEIIAAVDAYLRGERQVGYGIVLTATGDSPAYLGANVVVWLGDVLTKGADGIGIERAHLMHLFADGRQRASGAAVVEFNIDDDRDGHERGTLGIPGRLPWSVVGQQVVLVQRLVDAYHAGNPVVPAKVLFAGMKVNHPAQVFPGEVWREYIGHPLGKSQGWMLYTKA